MIYKKMNKVIFDAIKMWCVILLDDAVLNHGILKY